MKKTALRGKMKRRDGRQKTEIVKTKIKAETDKRERPKALGWGSIDPGTTNRTNWTWELGLNTSRVAKPEPPWGG